MRKPCLDGKCKRAGQELPLSEFYVKKDARDRRDVYCQECRRRRVKENRESPGRRVQRRRRAVPERKPLVMIVKPNAFSLVYDALVKGCRTRDAIQRETGLGFDAIGEALSELTFDCKAVRIVNREFVLVDHAGIARKDNVISRGRAA